MSSKKIKTVHPNNGLGIIEITYYVNGTALFGVFV